MKSTDRAQHHARLKESGMDNCTLPSEASFGIGPEGADEIVWSALVERARECEADAHRDLSLRLADFRQCFTPQLFADPEAAYGDFVRELVDQVRYGFLQDPDSLLAEARVRAMRKTADRIRSLTTAARVLSTLPKRHREVLIRAQLPQDCDGARVRRGRATAG